MAARLRELEAAGLIERSNSPYSSPAFLIHYADKAPRLVIDYRKLNSQTTRNATPIFRTQDILHECGHANFYFTTDFAAGFHQIMMDPDSIDKTAFATPDGLWHWLRMPMGVINGPPHFCRYVAGVFQDMIAAKEISNYFDDVIGHQAEWSAFITMLEKFFQRCRDAGLHLKADKTKIGFDSVKFLGHMITRGIITPLPDRVEAIIKSPSPTTALELRQLLGAFGYYRDHIPRYLEFSHLLTPLFHKDAVFKWTKMHEHALQQIKKGLANYTALYIPDVSKPFILSVDASQFGIGACYDAVRYACLPCQ
jgi:hypothetical protein